jgi:two-component system, NarL family, response regulator NreC
MAARPQVAPLLDSTPGSAAEPAIQVVLADGHALMRRRLRLLLEGGNGVEVVAEAGDLPAVIRHVHDHQPNVLVLDLSLSNGTSIEAVRHLRARVPGTEIVVLTMEASAVFAQQALDAGAIGFVLKHAAEAELVEGVQRAGCGEEYVSPRVAAGLAALRRAGADDGLAPLPAG